MEVAEVNPVYCLITMHWHGRQLWKKAALCLSPPTCLPPKNLNGKQHNSLGHCPCSPASDGHCTLCTFHTKAHSLVLNIDPSIQIITGCSFNSKLFSSFVKIALQICGWCIWLKSDHRLFITSLFVCCFLTGFCSDWFTMYLGTGNRN